MEHITVLLASDADFDDAVHNSLKEGRDLAVITKDNGTVGGRPVVCLTFTVELPDGTKQRVQTVNTLANWMSVFGLLKGRYGH